MTWQQLIKMGIRVKLYHHAEAKLDKTTPPNWVIYTLIGVGALVISFLAFWLGRKTVVVLQ